MTAAPAGAARVAIIIVHYKTPAMLRDCIATVLPEMNSRDRLVIVDNASGPEHLAALHPAVSNPAITLLPSDKNLGFAGANNLGIRHILDRGGADFFLLLNPDTLVRPGALSTLLAFLDNHPDVALVGPRLENPDASPQLSAFGDPTPISELVRGANIGPITRMLKRYEVYGDVQNTPHPCDWLSGACVLLRRQVVDKVGLLDAGFFMYYEEVDFFRRARKAGFRAAYEPAAHVVHLVGQASGVDWKKARPKRLPPYWFESRHRYFRKHFGYLGMVAADGFWLTGHLLNRLRGLFTGVSKSILAQHETRDMLRHSFRALFRPPGNPGASTA
jgi:GT2 family glycosyltransferase